MSFLYEIAVKTPLRKLFTYESDIPLIKGIRVQIPFRNQETFGFVMRETDQRPKGIKKILKPLDESPLLDDKSLLFFERSAEYYGISVGELLGSSLPEKVGAISLEKPKHFVSQMPPLNEAQNHIFKKISEKNDFSVHLIQGETGSGKTEIYCHLIDQVLMNGGQALFLVPEISLTPQLENRVTERLGAPVTVFHSQMSEKKRASAYRRALSGVADIFLGARSALFLPFSNLKLIVVDEEHDASYKQSERGAYHARDLALLRGKIWNIPVVLGSATPSLESRQRVFDREAFYYKLGSFYPRAEAPLEVIDLKKIWKTEQKSFISEALQRQIENCLSKKEQALIFLNRRGSASQRICLQCAATDECSSCSVNLTYHEDLKRLVCHWCGYQEKISLKCKACQGDEFFLGGIGTKQVESDLKNRFPEARIARLDRDEIKKKNILADTIQKFSDGDIDILVGTQMIAKGIDIQKLSLVGVVLADQGWGVPDFRSMEKALQLLCQLKGRGGRRGQIMKFLVQTFQPKHPVFEWLTSDDPMEKFYEMELPIRRMAFLPPFSKLTLWTLEHRDESLVQLEADGLLARMSVMGKPLGLVNVGPTPAPLHRWKGKYRYQILTKDVLKGHMSLFIKTVLDDIDRLKLKSRVKIDRDPFHFV